MEKTFLSVMQGTTITSIVLQICALPGLFRCQNDLLPLPIAEQKATSFKTKKSIYSFLFPQVLKTWQRNPKVKGKQDKRNHGQIVNILTITVPTVDGPRAGSTYYGEVYRT